MLSHLLLAWAAFAPQAEAKATPQVASASQATTEAVPPAARPNIMFFVADDQRADTIAALGNEVIQTPSLDRVATRGAAFSRVYCMGSYSGAVCAPSRAMLLSGRNLFHYTGNPSAPKDPAAKLLPELFREAGYQTFGTGKWHSGKEWFKRSFEDGGSIFFGGMGPHVGLGVFDFDPEGKYPNAAKRKEPRFTSTAFAEETIAFLQRRDTDRPFFAYCSFTAPHDPRTPPKQHAAFYSENPPPLPANFLPRHPFDNGELVIRDEKLAPWPRTSEVVRREIALYYAMITQMDEQIGRVLDELDAQGLTDSTLIVFASDHGLAVGSHGLLGKQNLYEHSMRTTAMFAGPGVTAGQRDARLGYLYDIYPSICQLAGIDIPDSVEGRSLFGPSAQAREGILTAYKPQQRAWTDGEWKIIWYPDLGRTQIFDLSNDPHETNDLVGEERGQAQRARLERGMRAAMHQLGDPLSPR